MNRRRLFTMIGSLMAATMPLLARREVDNTKCPKCNGDGHELGILSYWDKDGKEKLYLDWRLKECGPCRVKYCVYSPSLKHREGPITPLL